MRHLPLVFAVAVAAVACHPRHETVKFPVTEPDGRVVEVDKWWGFSPVNDPKVEKAFKLLQANKVEEARDILEDHVAADPKDAFAHYDLAVCYEVRADWKKAHEQIQKALELIPNQRTFEEENAFIERHLSASVAAK